MIACLWSKVMRTAVSFASLAVVWSCQTTTVIEEDPASTPGKHYVHFRVPDTTSLPDSLWYRSPLDSGSTSLSVDTKGLVIRLLPFLNQMDNRDSMVISTYRLGLHLGLVIAKPVDYMEIAGVRTVRTGADSLAISLLRAFDSLHKATPGLIKDSTAAGKRAAFQQAVAEFVFRGHPSTMAYARLAPIGLDTAQVNRQILTLAARSGLTLGEVVHQWNLALDYPAARKALASLSVDTASLNPFQLDTPLRLDPMHLGEPPVGLVGKIRGKKGIKEVKFAIENESGVRSDRFVLADVPELKNHPDLLDFAGQPTFAPRPDAVLGTYHLRLFVTDSAGNEQTYSTTFRLAGALDHSGPRLTVLDPVGSVVRDFDDPLLNVRIEAGDVSGVMSVQIDGKDASKGSDDKWSIEMTVPISATSKVILIQAKDSVGNASETQIHIRRNEAPAPTAPRLTLVGPANGTLVPFDSVGVWVEWRASTDFGKIEAVTIDGQPAKLEGDLWRLRVALSPDGKLVNLPVRAQSSVPLSITEFVSVGRKADSAGPVVMWGTPGQGHRVAYDIKALDVSVSVSDPSGLDSVRIAGKKPDTAGGQWKTTIDLADPGEITRIHVKAWDRRGNATDSVLLVSRDQIPGKLPPTLSWKSPSKTSGTILPFAESIFLVQCVLTDISGVDSASVLINGVLATQVNDSVWERSVDLPPDGKAQTITLEAKNKRGVSISGFVSVARAADAEKPTFTRIAGTKDLSVPFDTTFVEVGWSAKDNDRIAQAWIQDSLVGADATGYHLRVGLAVATQWIKFRAVDPEGNDVRDSVSVERRTDTVKAVTFSDTNGRLRSGSFWVKLSCATPGAVIHFTRNGADPTSADSIYADSIKIDTSITLKARGFAAGRVDGPVVTQGYQMAVPVGVSGSGTHFLVVLSDGSLWGFGSNNCNAIYTDLGCTYEKYPDGSSNGKLDGASWEWSPHHIDSTVLSASAGAYESFWIRADRSLWAVGSNRGSMGIATASELLSPAVVLREVSKVELVPSYGYVGGTGAVALQTNGNVWATGGYTGASRLTKSSPSWTKVAENAIDMSVSENLLLVLKKDRSLWGIGFFGGISVRSEAWTKIADSVETFPRGLSVSILFQKLDGSVWQAGYSLPGSGEDSLPLSVVPALAGYSIVQIESIGSHYLLRTSSGDVLVYGPDVPYPRVLASGIRTMSVGGAGLATISTKGDLRIQTIQPNWTLSTDPRDDVRIKF